MVPVVKPSNGAARFRLVAFGTFLALTAVPGGAAWAWPYCDSAVGRQVSAGIFNDGFGLNSLLTLLPLGVLLAIVAVIHFGLPWPKRSPQPVLIAAASHRRHRQQASPRGPRQW